MSVKVYDYYKDLPSWAKGVVVVGGIAIVYFTAKSFIKRIRTQADEKRSLQESTNADNELIDLNNRGIKPTLTDSNITSIINSLKDAMNGCGTNEKRVYDDFSKLNNEADVKLLIRNWGVQYYQPCAGSQPISYSKWLWNDKSFGGSISEWLNYDLSTSEINKVNDILAKKGIKHKF